MSIYNNNISLLIITILVMMLFSGCATQRLYEKINGKTETQYPTSIKNFFMISKIEDAQLDITYNPNVLFLCVAARVESGSQNHNNNSEFKKYFLSVSITKDNTKNYLVVDEYQNGCDKKFIFDSNRLQVSKTLTTIPAYVPSPIANHASKFNLDKIYNVGTAGAFEAIDETNPTRQLNYTINNQYTGGISSYLIFVRTKDTIIPVNEKPSEFTSKDFLAVFYPFTIVWDVITTPFIYLFLYINGAH